MEESALGGKSPRETDPRQKASRSGAGLVQRLGPTPADGTDFPTRSVTLWLGGEGQGSRTGAGATCGGEETSG